MTHAIATKRGNFTPARHFEGQEMIAKAGTVLGHDDGEPVTTPYDNCVLVMPSSTGRSGRASRLFAWVD